MRCGNQENCEDYKQYVKNNKENFPIDKHDEILGICKNNPPFYICRAIDNQDCSTIRTINLLEDISGEVGERKIEKEDKKGKIKNYLKNSLEYNLAFYALPTIGRKGENGSHANIVGFIGTIAQFYAYIRLAEKGIPAYWLPVATNILSGLYETGRYFYNKAEKKLVDKNKNIEKKVE